METIFLALSGLILVAGVIYWLWSHLQLTQKKVQLLENAVFELRGMLASSSGGAAGPGALADSGMPPPPVAVSNKPYKDLADDDWEDDTAPSSSDATPQLSTPLEQPPVIIVREKEIAVEDELAPGGRIQIGDEANVTTTEIGGDTTETANFKELFIATDGVSVSRTESLDGMPVRELRRLAEQRGIRGVAEMKKKELLAALRQQVAPPQSVATPSVTAEPVLLGPIREGEETLETEILD